MTAATKTTGQSYYDALPSLEQRVGDLWKNLPTFGHFRRHACRGIVITPACDLVNRKVETITYLPIMTVREYMLSRGFAVELVRVVKGQYPVAKMLGIDDWQIKGIGMPSDEVLLKTLAAAKQVQEAAGQKEKEAAGRICAAVLVLRFVRGSENDVDISSVRIALGGKEYERCLSDIIKNSYSPDIHFLPSDGRAGDMSVMEDHSVVLFRYPMAVPVELLDSANDISVVDWKGAISKLREEFPIVAFAEQFQPVKVGALRQRFLPDLISRFTTLHIRMGSPNFTRETVDEFIKEFGESVR